MKFMKETCLREWKKQISILLSHLNMRFKSHAPYMHIGFRLLLIAVVFLTQLPRSMDSIHASEASDYTSNIFHEPVTFDFDSLDITAVEKMLQDEIQDMKNTPKESWSDAGVCSSSPSKSYEEGNIDWVPSSKQYEIMQQLHINDMGMYESEDGYLAVALGSYYGAVGTKYKITLDTGIILKVIKADEKANKDVVNGCYHKEDSSVIEFIIHEPAASLFFPTSNGYVNGGNFNNHPNFQGSIIKIEKLEKA